MCVQWHDLLLIRGQVGGGPLQGHEDGVGLALEPDGGRALLHGLHGVLHLMQPPLRGPGGHIAVILISELKKQKQKLDTLEKTVSHFFKDCIGTFKDVYIIRKLSPPSHRRNRHEGEDVSSLRAFVSTFETSDTILKKTV